MISRFSGSGVLFGVNLIDDTNLHQILIMSLI